MMQLLGRNWNPSRRKVALLAELKSTLQDVRPCMESRLRHFVQIMVGSIHLMLSRTFWHSLDASMKSLLPIHKSRMQLQRGSTR